MMGDGVHVFMCMWNDMDMLYTVLPIAFVDEESLSTSTKYIEKGHPQTAKNQKSSQPVHFAPHPRVSLSIHKREKIPEAHPHPQINPAHPQSTITIGSTVLCSTT